MQTTNYCRQFLQQEAANPSNYHDSIIDMSHQAAMQLAQEAVKFILPDGGHVLEDSEYRALDALNLPFPRIALEYFEPSRPLAGRLASSKRIIFADQSDDEIMIVPAFWLDDEAAWHVFPPVGLDRSAWRVAEKSAITLRALDDRIPLSDYNDEAFILLEFLNALECSNVSEQKLPARKPSKSRAALPFDDYHVLMLGKAGDESKAYFDGNHRSPREHLRRGHIRRLDSGRKVWVNAAVVGAGRGAGKIKKDYALREAHQ